MIQRNRKMLKENVKLIFSLKTFQCDNHIVMPDSKFLQQFFACWKSLHSKKSEWADMMFHYSNQSCQFTFIDLAIHLSRRLILCNKHLVCLQLWAHDVEKNKVLWFAFHNFCGGFMNRRATLFSLSSAQGSVCLVTQFEGWIIRVLWTVRVSAV